MTWNHDVTAAPRDGTRVLMYATLRGASLSGADWRKDYGKHVVIAAWEPDYDMWWDGSQCTLEPLAWMPLPPLPPLPEVTR